MNWAAVALLLVVVIRRRKRTMNWKTMMKISSESGLDVVCSDFRCSRERPKREQLAGNNRVVVFSSRKDVFFFAY